MKTSSILWALIAVIIVGGGIWYFAAQNSGKEAGKFANTPSATEQNERETHQPETGQNSPGTQKAAPTATENSGSTASARTVTVTYNGSSFTPATLTINKGDTVTFVDSSSNPMWVASGVHPTHTLYDNTDLSEHCSAGYSGPTPFDECRASTDNYSFTFTETGTHPYHDHVKASATGKIIVR